MTHLHRKTIIPFVLMIFVCLLPMPANADWRKASSEHFTVYSELSEPALQDFADKVERYDGLLRAVTNTGNTDPGNKLTIFMVRNPAAIATLIGDANVYGFYAPEIQGSAAFIPRYSGSGAQSLDSETVLFHEYAHHFMLQYYPVGYPEWYIEGFAEYFGTTDIGPDGTAVVGKPPLFRAYGIIAGSPMPVTRLLAADQGKMSGEALDSFYGWSWMLVHYLRFEPSRKGQLTRYLSLFAAGTPPEEAAAQAFGDIAKLQSDLRNYSKRPRISVSQYRGLKYIAKPIRIVALTPDEGALIPLVMRMARGSRSNKDVADFLTDARRAAARYKGTATASELVAEGELDADNLDAATAANERLIEQRPGDPRALLRRARIAMARIDKGGGDAAWKAARSLIVKANRAAPDDPFPLALYYQSFGAQGIPPPQIAINGLRRAVELAPQVAEIRLQLGDAMIQVGRPDDARRAVAPLLNDPHSEENRQAARALLSNKANSDTKDSSGEAKKQ